ncbi:HEPN domain-containing protein [Cesiribacter andamanensis]|uniref:HEPN domain-containing protein n=1 Tax=Cesiribacter andamanensis AMV16 TaxID=1279009 RepID=M7N3R5_9BACT|nr:HEPN domain-containing protein [Cesiribacter andamanensis]EMR03303.1 hypothetical protein ADICEAN_01557 [Cesiribacter andamanensis AMV16]
MEPTANQLFSEAIDKLNQAKNEFFRPQEDLSPDVICQNAQLAVEHFLRGYLLNESLDPSEFTTLEELFDECAFMNIHFNRIDISAFRCRSELPNSRGCADIPKVCSCLTVASRLECLIREENLIT